MKIAIMQPYFFPYIGYFQLIKSVDKYILYDNLNFIKEAWVNRNRVQIKNSGLSWLSIPLSHKSSFTKIVDIKIDNSKNWRNKIYKTLELNYRKAPMYNKVYPFLSSILEYQTESLSCFNAHAIVEICKYLNINTLIEHDSSKYVFIENNLLSKHDYDESINIKIQRVFEICRYENANIFHNAIGGLELYPKELFASNNIEIYFIKTNPYNYKQYNNEFISDLSIIDVLMFNSEESINELLDNFELI